MSGEQPPRCIPCRQRGLHLVAGLASGRTSSRRFEVRWRHFRVEPVRGGSRAREGSTLVGRSGGGALRKPSMIRHGGRRPPPPVCHLRRASRRTAARASVLILTRARERASAVNRPRSVCVPSQQFVVQRGVRFASGRLSGLPAFHEPHQEQAASVGRTSLRSPTRASACPAAKTSAGAE